MSIINNLNLFQISPNDVLHCIFSHISKTKDIRSLLLTDKRISEFISNHQPLWQNLLPSHFPFHFLSRIYFPDAKGVYKQTKIREKNVRKNKCQKNTLSGHTRPVTGLATQGNILISASRDQTIKVRDLKTGKEKSIRVDHPVDRLVIHGDLLCSGSHDGNSIFVLNWKSGEKLFTLNGHKESIRCLAIHNGKLISGSADKTIKIWDLMSGEELHSWDQDYQTEVLFVQGNTLYSSNIDGKTIKAWDLENKNELFTINNLSKFDFGDWIVCMEVRGNTLFTGHSNGWIRMWDLNDKKEVKSWPVHKNDNCVTSLAIMGNFLFSASNDHSICAQDLENDGKVFTFNGHENWVRCLALQGGVLYSGSFDETIRIWDFNFPSPTPYDAKTLEENRSLLDEIWNARDIPEQNALVLKLHPDFQERLRQHAFKCYASFLITSAVIERVRKEVLLELLLDRIHAEDHKQVTELLNQFLQMDILGAYLCREVNAVFSIEAQERAVIEFKDNLKKRWGPDLPLLLADLGIITDEEFSQKLQCTPNHLGKVGIVSLPDLHALGILCAPAITPLELTTNDQQKQTQLGEKRKKVVEALKNLSEEIQKRRDENDHFGVVLFTDAQGQTIGDELSPWAVFQNQFNEIKAQLEEICSSPATLSKDNGELLEKTNALIDQFNAVDREYQIAKLRAYIHQPHLREKWDSLINTSLADYTQKNPKAKLYEMAD